MVDERHLASRTWQVGLDLMCIVDRDGRFVAANPRWLPTLGWSEDEIVGQHFRFFLHPDDVERSVMAFEVVKSGQPIRRFDNRYRRKDGGYRWFSWVAVPEGDHVYCTVRDVTDDKAREQTIADQREEARLREQLLAVLGHDLRNPLAALAAGVSILSRDEQGPRSEQVLRQMQASIARMDELVVNMMDFARVRLGDGLGLRVAPCPNLEDRVRGVVGEVAQAHPDVQIEVNADLTGEPRCDADRVMQVLANLLSNAATHGAPNAPIGVELGDTGDRLSLSVCNRGEPISEAARSVLFQPFLKGDARASRQGLGLGLYICAQIAEAHGGTLGVSSDERATCFTLDLPA